MSINNTDAPKIVQAVINARINQSLDATIGADVSNLKAHINADIASSKGIPQEILDHLVDYDNPHRITPEQIGTLSAEDIRAEINKTIYISKYELPSIGQPNTLYVVANENEDSIYIWRLTGGYRCVGSNYKNIRVIDGGNANG